MIVAMMKRGVCPVTTGQVSESRAHGWDSRKCLLLAYFEALLETRVCYSDGREIHR